MQKILLSILLSFSPVLFIACEHKSNQMDIEESLLNTLSKFPQLAKSGGNQYSFYKPVRSVILGENGIEIQLRSAPDTLEDPQKLIVVINRTKDIYVIPLFSNTYHDYWEFQFDSVLTAVKRVNSTFDQELHNCLLQLKLYDTLGTAGKVIYEMMISLLQCQQIAKNDSLKLSSINLTNNYELPYENSDSCFNRIQKNWQEISQILNNTNDKQYYDAFLDRSNHRVYMFNFMNFRRKQKIEFGIKTYRQDCVYQMLIL